MNRPRRARQNLARPTRRRDPKPRILVVCEGAVTEVDYLGGIKSLFKSLPVEVREVGVGRDPLAVVQHAVELRNEAKRDAKRGKDDNLLFEQVWCLVDVDEHTRLPQALDLAWRQDVEIVVSNPCFEIWLLYHFQDYTSSVHRHVLCKEKLPQHIAGYDKRLPSGFPYSDHPTAKSRAQRAEQRHEGTRRAKDRNPSTGVWRVVEAIQQAGKSAGRSAGDGRS
ncbi:RloB family protein [Streptomonospora litoralis]|uniref:RloB-like protein n=1 Tax=Streptomonospora litoralis TaxID=2498135 RepID=A0A4P6Q351_9ACTN|nr:RloB family protein [Streptomonospora litoralis]QBI53671.1 hypothetical protein EKD16_09385 [Streptomonospora litoralis]